MALVHCRVCNGGINKDTEIEGKDWISTSVNWYYHKHCYDEWEQKKKNIQTTDSNPTLWLDATWQYMKKIQKQPLAFSKFNSQWLNFITKKGYTPKGIYFSLRYFYEVKQGDPSKSEGGIGIVPYIYKDACAYWVNRNKLEVGICDRIQQQVMESMNVKTTTITQPASTFNNLIKTYNLDEIEGDDE